MKRSVVYICKWVMGRILLLLYIFLRILLLLKEISLLIYWILLLLLKRIPHNILFTMKTLK